ncbi:HEAT repeat domain-containing protein [Actinoplanes sp. NPDC026619]|uniref:HEAT repeat domain-containing protein n=1 Tax=Actinoplanes sp. NPDC026619 TaxID=3155798 RepID=UPI0033CAF4FB
MGLVRRKAEPEQEPQAVSPDDLMRQLDDPDPEVRRVAALSLDGVAKAVESLLDRVAAERESAVRDAMLTTLAAHDSDQVAAGLAVHLASDDAELRTAAAEALATMPASVPAIIPRLLEDPDHDVRVMTAMVLADLSHPESLTWLTVMIKDDPHPNVVTSAIDALLPSLGPEHTELLERAVRRFPDDPFLRFTVEAALR